MRRLLGLLSLPLALSALVAPMAGSADAVGVNDIEARAGKIIALANSGYPSAASKLRPLVDADTFEFLDERVFNGNQFKAGNPDCKVSAVSTKASRVYVCALSETRTVHKWWLYFRQVDGRWTAVNHRIRSSATVFRNEQAVKAARDRLVSLALAGDDATIATLAEPAAAAFIKKQAANVKNPVYGGEYKFTTTTWCSVSLPGTKAARFGAYNCGIGSWCPDDCESYALGFKAVNGRWIATAPYQSGNSYGGEG